MNNYALKNKVIFSILTVICISSLQMTYAEPEFSFKFGSIGTGEDELDNPTDVILSKNGKNIYVVDSNNDRINVFEKNGDKDFVYGTFCDVVEIQNCNDNADGADANGDGQFNNPLAIARDASKKFFVVDSDNERIQIFDKDGKFKSKFGSSDSGLDEYLGNAKGIVVQESTRKILVSNVERDSISVFSSDESFLFRFNSFDGRDSFLDPTNMVIDNSEQMLYVADSGNNRIVIFELVTGTTCPSGTEKVIDGVCFVEKFGSIGSDNGEFDDPVGLAFDSSNNLLYVSESGNDRIQIFEIVDGDTCPSETVEVVNGVCFVEKFGSFGSDNGEFDTPMGIALYTAKDLLFVADSVNDRIQAFTLNSGPIVLLPSKPVSLKGAPVSPTSIIISWGEPKLSDNIPAISGYKIEYKIRSGNYDVITENTTSTSFIHQGLDRSETYSYKVYSINSEGISVSSASVTTKPEHTTEPSALIATAISDNQIKLSWMPPSETFKQTISGYDVKREVSTGVYDTIGHTNSDTTSFIVSGLRTDKTYTYAVSANIGYGSTTESNSASATPRSDSVDTSEEPITSTVVQTTISKAPIKLTGSVVSSTQINLTWRPPVEDGDSPITGYKIEVKKDRDSFSTLIADTDSTTATYSHQNLIKDSMYTYRVSAINDVGTSDPSNEFSATTTIRSTNNIQISPLGKLNIDEGKLLRFTVKLSNNSVKDVIFSLDKNPPAGSKIISTTGVFSWTPISSDGGKTYTLDIVAKKDGIEDRETLTITVNDVISNSQPEPKPAKPKELGLAAFVVETKDPQSYVDRYNNEDTYKEWFDENFSEYDSIYHAVGLEETLQIPASFVVETNNLQSYVDRYNNEDAYKKWFDENFSEYDSIYHAVGLEETLQIPASFVVETNNLQSYVDRYNNEDAYKKWFDENFSEYDSIYHAVGLEEAVVEEKKFGICGIGTKLIDEVCIIVERPEVKPWWKFW